MLSIYQVDGFLDRLSELDREAPALTIAVEATALTDDNPARTFLNQRRAAAACDAHYLDGMSMRDIATACGKTAQSVRNWLDEYGPAGYLTIGEERDNATHGERRLVLRVVKMESDDKLMQRKLRQQVAAGRRIVPARRNLLDDTQPDGYAAGIDVEALWAELAP
jgi:hypothetical protein